MQQRGLRRTLSGEHQFVSPPYANGLVAHLIRRAFMDIWPGNPYPLGANYDGAE